MKNQYRPKLFLMVMAMSVLLTQTFLCAQSDKEAKFSFVALGDMPYFLPQDYQRFENVIVAINKTPSAFSVFVGDIKASTTLCSEEVYQKMYTYFGTFEKPLIYTPGDNEWTDCSKKEAGSYDPEERLEVIRKIFFKENTSLGKNKMPLVAQSSDGSHAKFVENKRWHYGNVAFGTCHIVGSNNFFLPESKNGNKEFFERNQANMAWLDEIFKDARKNNRLGIVLCTHADMFSPYKADRAFQQFIASLKTYCSDYAKPVLLINGDSHQFLVDKPLEKSPPTKDAIPNFTRVQVFGEKEMHAVKITVDPESNALFLIEQFIVPGN